MIFHSSRKFDVGNRLSVKLLDTDIKQVQQYKYLGVYINAILDFSYHFNKVIKKVK